MIQRQQHMAALCPRKPSENVRYGNCHPDIEL